ncbi:BlaI/MecI/CopY family transcriptional regulator [Clostridium sp. FP2]|uniref:BlaI/MecI/CopY family transcriptional regulator n=1 Tax=Clostridium sp. FP2 TaxID=2724481 RepID=UPI0013E96227|nr:BlaI/MecI/CopY family transcriptional regulator [Clostridium sp. FP2]MBZ9622358.1 BlaI/MecI/CopY family transcriptional regulator [Clostridium sp. FP2]
MSNIPNISEAEWEVMKIIWEQHPCTSSKIIELLENGTNWQPKTVKSLISRLLKKSVINFNAEGRSYYYYPLVSEKDCIKEESKSFIKRVYNGVVKNMVLNFIEDDKLTKEDIAELERILKDRK